MYIVVVKILKISRVMVMEYIPSEALRVIFWFHVTVQVQSVSPCSFQVGNPAHGTFFFCLKGKYNY